MGIVAHRHFGEEPFRTARSLFGSDSERLQSRQLARPVSESGRPQTCPIVSACPEERIYSGSAPGSIVGPGAEQSSEELCKSQMRLFIKVLLIYRLHFF